MAIPQMDPNQLAHMGVQNPFAPPIPPPPSPSVGFQSWASDPRNAQKIQAAMTPPDAPLQPGAGKPTLASVTPPSVTPMASANPPSPPTFQQDQEQNPAKYAQPIVRGTGTRVLNAIVAGLQGAAGGLNHDPGAGVRYAMGVRQHDENIPLQNQQIYQNTVVAPQDADIQRKKALADIANIQSEIDARNKPDTTPEKPFTVNTDQGVLQWDGQHWTPITVNGKTAMVPEKAGAVHPFQRVAGTSGGKQVFANYDPMKGVFTDQSGNVLSDFKPSDKSMQGAFGQYAPIRLLQGLLNTAYNENPALLPYVGKLAKQIMSQYGAGAGAEEVFGATPEGQPQNEAGGSIGLKMPEAPTGSTRSRGQFAAATIPAIDEAKQQIAQLGDKLGPMSGRWYELYTGKVGAYGPEYSGLQTTLQNIGTAWMRLHANSEGARQEFENTLKTARDPANLIANLNAIEKQAQDYKKIGQGKALNPLKPPAGPQAAPKEGTTKKNAAGDTVVYRGGQWQLQ